MSDLIARTLNWLGQQLRGRLSLPGDQRYAVATAIWAKPVGRRPRAVVHCRTPEDIQFAIRAARECGLPLSVLGGGHDWAGRALCEGIVIDLSAMRNVTVSPVQRTAQIAGAARAADVAAKADRAGLAAVTGSVGAVGMAGLTLGGGYGPLIGRFGLALDNLLAAAVVLADGSVVVADSVHEPDLFWALRGGGGNFGVVIEMRHRLHALPSVHSGMLIYPFSDAQTVLAGCAEITAAAPDELTAQIGLVAGPASVPVVMVVPTWCGPAGQGEARLAPFNKLGTLLAGSVEARRYGAALTLFDPYLTRGRPTVMETCWLPTLDGGSINLLLDAMTSSASAGCAIFTHEFRGAASCVPTAETAFGLRRDHVLIEILAAWDDRSGPGEAQRHRRWARATRDALAVTALPGGYPNLLDAGDRDRVADSFGENAARLGAAKRRYDPENIFSSAIPLPVGGENPREGSVTTMERESEVV
jgi:FAD/FMN-containing dehydrogenase